MYRVTTGGQAGADETHFGIQMTAREEGSETSCQSGGGGQDGAFSNVDIKNRRKPKKGGIAHF